LIIGGGDRKERLPYSENLGREEGPKVNSKERRKSRGGQRCRKKSTTGRPEATIGMLYAQVPRLLRIGAAQMTVTGEGFQPRKREREGTSAEK